MVGAAFSHILVGIVTPHLTSYGLFTYMFIFRLIIGFCEGVLQIAGAGVIIRVLPENIAPMAVGGMEGMRSLAFLVAPIFGSDLYLASDSNPRLPYVLLGGLVFGFLLIVQSIVSAAKSDLTNRTVQQETPPMLPLISKPPAIAMMIALCINMFPVTALEPALEPYLTKVGPPR